MSGQRQRDNQRMSPEALVCRYRPYIDSFMKSENKLEKNCTRYSYLMTGQYSELEIVDKTGHRWAVHKVIVSPACEFFANAIKGGFKEAETNAIELPNDDPAAVKALLEYIYTEDFKVITGDDKTLLMFHVEVYIIGEIYNMPGLKDLAFERLVSFWVAKDSGGCPLVTPIVKRIYEGTPESDRRVRDFLVDFSMTHIHGLLLDKKFLNLMIKYPTFRRKIAHDVLRGQDIYDCKDLNAASKT